MTIQQSTSFLFFLVHFCGFLGVFHISELAMACRFWPDVCIVFTFISSCKKKKETKTTKNIGGIEHKVEMTICHHYFWSLF